MISRAAKGCEGHDFESREAKRQEVEDLHILLRRHVKIISSQYNVDAAMYIQGLENPLAFLQHG